MKNFGACLIIAFGCLLSVGDLGAGGAQVGFVTCGSANAQAGANPVQQCPTGTISVTKTVVGSGTLPAQWTVTLGSTDCPNSLIGLINPVDIPSGGGVANFNGLFVAADFAGTMQCHYTVTETPVTDWTPSFATAGPYTVTAGQTTIIALTNTATPATTTTAPATTTTTIAASTTTALATTTTNAAVAPETPTAPTAVTLPATGSKTSRPTFYVGLALILLGSVILLTRRRSSQPTIN